MFAASQNFRWSIQLALALLMVLTRFHQADGVFLPDASWAVFFLSGFFSAGGVVFTILIALAGTVDYLAINVGGISDWCVTSGYGFLIPAYGVLWLAGQYCRRYRLIETRSSAMIALVVVVSAALAFTISNAGFFLFSERFSDLNWYQYSAAVVQYFPSYLGAMIGYVAIAIMLHLLVSRFSSGVIEKRRAGVHAR